MQCPFIDKRPPDPKFNIPINYRDCGGAEDYVFYDHDNGFGWLTRVQFCQMIGRKKDVFQCLNESEWRACPYYRVQRDTLERSKKDGEKEKP